MGHLVLEKILKVLYVKNVDNSVPKVHDLLRLADKALIEIPEEREDELDLITIFNISTR